MVASRITFEFVKKLNRLAVGGNVPLPKPNELHSAIARPLHAESYGVTNPIQLAAELAYGIIMNHPFADGNKRTAFLAANEFLRERNHPSFFDSPVEEVAHNPAIMDLINGAHDLVATNQVDKLQLGDLYTKSLENLKKKK